MWIVIVVALLAGCGLAADNDKPDWQRLLSETAEAQVRDGEGQIAKLTLKEDFKAVAEIAESLAKLRREQQGADHWQSREALRAAESWRLRAGFDKEQSAAAQKLQKALPEVDELITLGQLDEAVMELDDAEESAIALFGKSSLNWAEVRLRQARCHWSRRQQSEAYVALGEVVGVQVKQLGLRHPTVAATQDRWGEWLALHGDYRPAIEHYQVALEIREACLGPQHSDTAVSHNRLAIPLFHLSRYPESEQHFRKALAIFNETRGEHSLESAATQTQLADCLRAQGRFDEADPLLRSALKTFQKVAPEPSPETATCYNVLGLNLLVQGRAGEAETAFRKSIGLWQRLSQQPTAALAPSINNLANALASQGRYQEAESDYKEVMALLGRTVTDQHPSYATASNNLANNYIRQGKFRLAQPHFEHCLKVRQATLLDDHPDTGQAHFNLGMNLNHRGDNNDSEEALKHLERAAEILEKRLPRHPDTALGFRELGLSLEARGDNERAESLLRRALDLHRETWGEGHPDTAHSYALLARHTADQGQDELAEPLWRAAAHSFEQARRRIALTGIGRAARSAEYSPLEPLAVLLARREQPTAAWDMLERNLARGLLDDLVTRQSQRLTDADRLQQRALTTQLQQVQVRIAALSGGAVAVGESKAQLRERESRLFVELAEFEQKLLEQSAVLSGSSAPLAEIQKVLAADEAMIAWIDLPGREHSQRPQGEHLAVILRKRGEPQWVNLVSKERPWSSDDGDDELGTELASSLAKSAERASAASATSIKKQISKLQQQRLEPLLEVLRGNDQSAAVRKLIVLPSASLRGVPVELLVPESWEVSYAPSATVLVWLRSKAPRAAALGQWLGVGDPVFSPAPVVPPPKSGLELTQVTPNGQAAQAGLKAGDLLLSYADAPLKELADLLQAQKSLKADVTTVSVEFWRDSKRQRVNVGVGKLGVSTIAYQAAVDVAEARAISPLQFLKDQFSQLPGTRLELNAISADPGPRVVKPPELLLGSEASEQRLSQLATQDALRKFRWLHFATHGVPDSEQPLRSRLILARDHLADIKLDAGFDAEVYRGELSAERVLRDWALDADLVVLSACQSGLGRYAGGEGYLGFAQALLLSGAKNLLLSLWKVDDQATALLMKRFYENLWASRPGMNAPLATSEALREAKSWLRKLSQTETDRLWKSWQRGDFIPTRDQVEEDDGSNPFQHPKYWAAFVLIGSA
ncbi:MAG: tetratricopeptide repeat protein [Planctomycetaceae bacterium]